MVYINNMHLINIVIPTIITKLGVSLFCIAPNQDL